MLMSIISCILSQVNQLFKLTAHDMRSALVNEKLENHGSQRYSSKRVKVINPKPTETPIKVPTAI